MISPPAAFFETFTAFVDGSASPDHARAELVSAPDDIERLDLYRSLVLHRYVSLLETMFPAVKRAFLALEKGSFEDLVEAYARTRPSGHWDINALGEGFSAFLDELQKRDGLPSYLSEIADLQYLRHSVATCEPFSDPALTLRHYTHGVLSFARSVARGEPARAVDSEATLCLVGRSMITGEVHMLTPTLAMVLIVADTLPNTEIPKALADRVNASDLAQAREELAQMGLVSRTSREESSNET